LHHTAGGNNLRFRNLTLWRKKAMKTLHVLVAMVSLALLVTGCPKKEDPAAKKEDPIKTEPGKTEPGKKEQPAPGALAADADYASGNISAAVMEVQTKLDVANMGPEGTPGEDVKKAQEGSVTSQVLTVSDARGKMLFDTPDFYVPKGTELRYNPAHKKYVLADPAKKQYWAMTGSEIGNLLEGGPSMTRSNYTIAVKATEDKETIAGFETVKSDVELGFDWTVKTKSGEKKGKVKVKLAIWHSADAKLKEPWGKMMVDFLTVPFQDDAGQKVVDELKSKVKFPVKWAMEVMNEGQAKEKGESHPKLVTVAQKLEVKDVAKADLAAPPAGFAAATGPYEFGEGGQTAKDDLLGKIPAKKGTPPKDVKAPEEKKEEKK
jgi:hypothetical protein